MTMIEYTQEELESIWSKLGSIGGLFVIRTDALVKGIPYEKLVFYPKYSPYKDILFEEPLERVPLYINSNSMGHKVIACWRLKAGK